MYDDHPVKQKILSTQLPCDESGNPIDYVVGKYRVTRIEACSKPGEFCTIPYIRVWVGDICAAEFCQHKASYVRFSAEPLPNVPDDNLPF